jgi:hypothetical protein
MLPTNPALETGQTCDRLPQAELLLAAAYAKQAERMKAGIDERLAASPSARAAADLMDEALLYLRMTAAGQ